MRIIQCTKQSLWLVLHIWWHLCYQVAMSLHDIVIACPLHFHQAILWLTLVTLFYTLQHWLLGWHKSRPLLCSSFVKSSTKVLDDKISFAFIMPVETFLQVSELYDFIEQIFGLNACIFWEEFFDNIFVCILILKFLCEVVLQYSPFQKLTSHFDQYIALILSRLLVLVYTL